MNPSEKEKTDWEEDITSVKEVASNETMMPKAVDPTNPMRDMMRLSSEEQMALNQEYATRAQEESAECSSSSVTPTARKPMPYPAPWTPVEIFTD